MVPAVALWISGGPAAKFSFPIPVAWGMRREVSGRGLGPKQKQNKDLAPRERGRGIGEGINFVFIAYSVPDSVQRVIYVI